MRKEATTMPILLHVFIVSLILCYSSLLCGNDTRHFLLHPPPREPASGLTPCSICSSHQLAPCLRHISSPSLSISNHGVVCSCGQRLEQFRLTDIPAYQRTGRSLWAYKPQIWTASSICRARQELGLGGTYTAGHHPGFVKKKK